jgi:hypothetical protein
MIADAVTRTGDTDPAKLHDAIETAQFDGSAGRCRSASYSIPACSRPPWEC